ncbi:MAG: glycosyltransferase [Deltaproteobacteria bacterium]|nr:glycosyltransferase [Deltaproteobacteria bacterium]
MPDGVNPTLLRNLAALRGVDPDLVERITWPCGSEHVSWGEDGEADYLIHTTWHALSMTQTEIDACVRGLDLSAPILVFGMGLGEVCETLARFGKQVLAWERDPWLLRQVLSRRDWGDEIRSGRVRFLLTTDVLEFAGQELQIVEHPLLGHVYRHERELLRSAPGEHVTLLGAGGLFVDDVADALRAEGHRVLIWDTDNWAKEELARSAEVSGAQRAVTINYVHGLAETCAELGLSLRVWEIDPSTDDLPPLQGGPDGPAAQGARIGTWRLANVDAFEAAGFTDVVHLPLAANPERRHPAQLSDEEAAKLDADVIFVGSSMVEQGLSFRRRLIAAHVLARGGDPTTAFEEAENAIESVLSIQRDDFSVYRVPELLAEALPTLGPSVTNEAVLNALAGARPDALLGEMAAADKRITYVANLGQVGIHVWGDEGWKHAADYGAVWRGRAGHGKQLTEIYSQPAIHLDIGRLYQTDIITMRVFDVLACGGFCLAEWSPQLGDLFEIGVELDCYRTLEEMLEKTGHWLEQGPEARAEVGRRGRERILRDHTIAHRVKALLS